MLCACALAQMVCRSSNLSLGTSTKWLGSCPGWLSPRLPAGSGRLAAFRSCEAAPELSQGIWWHPLRRRRALGTSQVCVRWVGAEDQVRCLLSQIINSGGRSRLDEMSLLAPQKSFSSHLLYCRRLGRNWAQRASSRCVWQLGAAEGCRDR